MNAAPCIPLLSAIELHREALADYLSASSFYGSRIPLSSDYDAAEKAATEARQRVDAAWDKIIVSQPPERASDLARLAIHLEQVVKLLDHETEETSLSAQAIEVFRQVAQAFAGREALQ